jgi:hypothetical protein
LHEEAGTDTIFKEGSVQGWLLLPVKNRMLNTLYDIMTGSIMGFSRRLTDVKELGAQFKLSLREFPSLRGLKLAFL